MSINLTPDFWGAHGWVFLHSITFNYPKNPTNSDKLKYKKFFESIGDILPCEKCRINYKEHIRINPINDHLNSKTQLIKWLIDIHNMTNNDLNKPILSYEEVMYEYRSKIDNKNIYLKCIYILVFIVFICLIYFTYIN